MVVIGYIRLSRDEDKENYSSIEAQQDIIYDFAKRMGWTISQMYIDDNYSGYTFDRPEFKKLRAELEKGNIDIIIAKDLSRIGRHNAKTLLLIEEIQSYGKRIILPEEGRGYDSDADDDDILGIKTWYNERYVKDISRKIKANMYIKQKKGELVMGNLYGYVKDPYDKSKLYVDENIRPVIELIFKLYIDGLGYKKICDVLNEAGYPTPSLYIKQKHTERNRVFKNLVSSLWLTHNIRRIIQNDLYIGVLRTHKKQNKKVKGKQEKVPIEDQFVFQKHHEPVISIEDFELAQQINQKRRVQKYKGSAKYNYVFSSFIVCGDCGFAGIGKNLGNNQNVKRGYECNQYSKYGLKRCVSHYVKERTLLIYFKEFLKDLGNQYQDCINSFSFQSNKKNVDDTLNKFKIELNTAKEELKILINQKVRALLKDVIPEHRGILENSYTQLESEKMVKIAALNSRLTEIQKVDTISSSITNVKTTKEIFDRIIQAEYPQRKDLELILDKIYIYSNKFIEFKMRVDINEMTNSAEE